MLVISVSVRTLKTLLSEPQYSATEGFYSVDKHGCAGSFSTRREQAVWRCCEGDRDVLSFSVTFPSHTDLT